MTEAPDPRTERVLILAPSGRDAALTRRILEERGHSCALCAGASDLHGQLARGAAVLVLAEEAIVGETCAALLSWLEDQPVWSDLPLVVLCREEGGDSDLIRSPKPVGNVTLLERPVRIATLVSAVQAALRARRRQYEVRDLLERLAESDRRKDEFLAMLGHELRNPLGAISAAAALLGDPRAEEAVRRRQPGQIARQVRHLARIVDDLLDLSRLSRGKIALRTETVDLAAVVRGAVEMLDLAGLNGSHRVRVDLPWEPVCVDGDPIRLEQVVVNLLDNALKYTPKGGTVDVSVAEAEGAAVLRVRDDGAGIAPEALARVFEPFTQLGEPLSRSNGGLGVGLHLSRHLVELHGGRIEAASEGRGRGSEFAVRLPRAPSEAGKAAPGGAAAARPAAGNPRGTEGRACPEGLRVLLVEDHRAARQALQELLRVWGCRVDAAPDGTRGLELGLAGGHQVVLVDIQLPDLDGYEVARRLREGLGERCGRLVAITGFGQPADRRRALDAGFDQHLVKPVQPDELSELLGAAAPLRATK